MDKIIILQDGKVLNEVELDKQQIVIGRDEKNVICLSDISVSRRHALLTCALDEYFIEDLGSTNGTLLNDRPISKHMLKNGDQIRVGEYVLSFERTVPQLIMDDDPEKTQVINMNTQRPTAPPVSKPSSSPFSRPAAQSSSSSPFSRPATSSSSGSSSPFSKSDSSPSSRFSRPAARSSSPFAKPASLQTRQGDIEVPVAPKTATVKYFRGPKKGSSEEINRSLYTLGRPGGDVAVIARRSQGFYLMKIGNSSVPTINDKKVEVGGGIKLNDGDKVEIGENAVEISFAS
jgi:pSer/pThr/pTyr-binding forkhead associated (FHA) protein